MSDLEYGIGAYTLTEAGRSLDVSPATLKRWLFGYSYQHHGPETTQEPLWRAQYGSEHYTHSLLGLVTRLLAQGFADTRPFRGGASVCPNHSEEEGLFKLEGGAGGRNCTVCTYRLRPQYVCAILCI